MGSGITRIVLEQRKKHPNQQGAQPAAAILSFKDFLDPTTTELKPSTTLLSLNEKPVRTVGLLAQMENWSGASISARTLCCAMRPAQLLLFASRGISASAELRFYE